MSETYTSSRNIFGDLTNNSVAANLTLGDKLINIAIRQILNKRKWPFLEKSDTDDTVASQQFYNLKADYGSLISVTITVGSVVHHPKEITTRRQWDALNETSSTSDTPKWYYIFNDQVGFYPKPSSADNTITEYFLRRGVNLSIADFTTGTIVTATNGSTAIVGGSTSWTAGMAGKWIKITPTAAAKGGDGIWYEIASITDGTNLVLEKEYIGTSIATGSAAYIIGDVSLIPEDFQYLPIYKAIEVYYSSVKPEVAQASLYRELYNDGLADLVAQFSSKSDDVVVSEGAGEAVNPNLQISL